MGEQSSQVFPVRNSRRASASIPGDVRGFSSGQGPQRSSEGVIGRRGVSQRHRGAAEVVRERQGASPGEADSVTGGGRGGRKDHPAMMTQLPPTRRRLTLAS